MGSTKADESDRLNKLFNDLQQDWNSMKKSGKSLGSAITIDNALRVLETSPRNLMCFLQNDHMNPKQVSAEINSVFGRGRKLFDEYDDGSAQPSTVRSVLCNDSDDENEKIKTFSPISSSSRIYEQKKVKMEGSVAIKRRRLLSGLFLVCLLICLVWIFLINSWYDESREQRITLVPT